MKPTRLQQQRHDAASAVPGQTTAQPRIYLERHNGASVIDQMRRYCRASDPDRIGQALYQFLTAKCGLEAHFGLKPPDGGFRHAYRHPADLIEELLAHTHHPMRHGHTGAVYRDGLTDAEVYAQVAALARDHHAAAERDREQRRRDEDLSVAQALARRYGHELREQQDER